MDCDNVVAGRYAILSSSQFHFASLNPFNSLPPTYFVASGVDIAIEIIQVNANVAILENWLKSRKLWLTYFCGSILCASAELGGSGLYQKKGLIRKGINEKANQNRGGCSSHGCGHHIGFESMLCAAVALPTTNMQSPTSEVTGEVPHRCGVPNTHKAAQYLQLLQVIGNK